MKNENHQIRIKDIATLAGVSEGTVDRVLHNRGEVSEKSKVAVEKVLEEINYSPNLLARSLASKKHFKFAYLIPEHLPKDYWDSVENGFVVAARDFLQYNIHLEKHLFNQYDVNSFISASSQIVHNKPDAVIIAPIFKEDTIKLTETLSLNQIPFSFIDSMVEEADFLTYYGQNSFQSGYIAAKLLLQSFPENGKVVIIRTKRKGAVSNQTIARRNGFIHYISSKNLFMIQLIDVELSDDDEIENYKLLNEVFLKYNDIKAAITFNSKVSRLANHLEKMNRKDIRLIGYDLLAENIKYLKKDVISYLLGQRPDKQAYFTVHDICNKLILKQEVKQINYVPVDILIKENIEDYLQFGE
jgi:LacI family transcriptional regulator